MDRSWIFLKNKLSEPHVDGVESFIEFAKAHSGETEEIKCPCTKCVNHFKHAYNTVRRHLLRNGMRESYTTWIQHGEILQPDDSDESENEVDDDYGDYEGLMEDHFRGTYMEGVTLERETVQNFEKLLKASQQGLYPGCKETDTLLSFVIEMLQVKVEHKWSNTSFNKVLEIFKKFLPKKNIVPGSIYESKKLLRDLGLGYDLIDACKNDCILFWKENAHLDKCPTCHESRYKVNDGRGKKIPHKILRYFPLTPRLRRLYMSPKTAKDMRWHNDKRVDDGLGRHPADCKEWKEFDKNFTDFAREIRNVRLGMATDGFNPFGNLSTSYSMWPVVLMPYNLPPWMAMKDSFFMLSLIIPGPNQPGNDIDVYLKPLIDELNDLWKTGVPTYDASTGETFQMHAALMWTINDFPVYGDVSGWGTKGYYACPICNDNPLSRRLIDKLGWVGHRAYLPKKHSWRKDKKFDGYHEKDMRSLDLSVNKVEAQVNAQHLHGTKFGKTHSKKKRPRDPQQMGWKKRSILWDLPYWMSLKLRHNLDVMHIEKNICENCYGIMLGIDGKNKDTYKAREDLKNMGIRPELHLQSNEDGSVVKPPAVYTLDPTQVDLFCEFLKSICYPDGYAANISRCVGSKNGKLSGLKSHDCHVLLQRLLPIGMRGFVNKEICTALFELGSFFQELCSKALRQSDLEKMEEGIVLVLCKLEKIFPPAFFDVMVHLAVHLPREAMLAGPVQYRWMYPVERFLGTLKGYVTNRARPEGSIAEAYIVKECLTFCSMYLKVSEKSERNDDGGKRGFGMEIFSQHVRLFSPILRALEHSQNEKEKAHWYVLNNTDEVLPYLKEHEKIVNNSQGRDVAQIQQEEFPNWFKKHMNELRTQGSAKATEELWSLANGPDPIIDLYSGCISNGVRFHTRDRENHRRCQNSGLVVEGYHGENQSLFYGYISKIWELRYLHGGRVVLFQCEWYNTGRNKVYKDEHVTSIDISRLWYKDDPFVLPGNAMQVFYINDTSKGKNWRVVERVRHRGLWDVPERDDDGAFQQDISTAGVSIRDEDFDLRYRRDDMDSEIIPANEQRSDHIDDASDEDDTLAEYVDDEEDEMQRLPDLDVDPDMDYDV